MSRQQRIWAAITLLGIVHGAILFAGYLVPYDPSAQDREYPFAPPTRLHFVDSRGRFHLRPFVYRIARHPEASDRYKEDTAETFSLSFFANHDAVEENSGTGSRHHLFSVKMPGRIFLLGTDEFGRDQFSRLLYGGRISLLAGLAAAAVSLLLGLVLGALAGFYGKWVDETIMRLAELFLALPWLYCLLAFRAFLPLHIAPSGVFIMLILVIGAVGWARVARLIRGAVLSAKERNYVLAARGFGASGFRLVSQHVLPETYGIVLTQGTLLIPQYILAEVTLSFLGLGVGEPAPSWGNMLASLQRYHVLVSYRWMLAPGIALAVLVFLYYTLANALQER